MLDVCPVLQNGSGCVLSLVNWQEVMVDGSPLAPCAGAGAGAAEPPGGAGIAAGEEPGAGFAEGVEPSVSVSGLVVVVLPELSTMPLSFMVKVTVLGE